MPYENLSDEDIMRQIQSLQKSRPTDDSIRLYFEELYRRYYQRAYNLGRFYGLEKYDAEDAAQDAFLKLLLHGDQFRTNQNFSAWFMRIVFRVILDKFREKKRHGYQDIDEIAETLEKDDDKNFLEKLHFQDELQRIINRTPEKIRMVIILRVYGEMSFHEIAQVLHISLRQVHNRLKQGMEMLKKYGKEG
ncbi:RNA polymerase sigma factor [Thermospira aquatica]|uniref:RNA polymerase sigma factor n=1 Tax=Thermospira aquatica TaxID=2828656 RepID=A0AAX3BBJ0_9SPIR|nr:RNA polymerase sigma factor [Thermospira aquatica]URA09399.1 RNA polymerase sigma factor [Thermospira aquatica]